MKRAVGLLLLAAAAAAQERPPSPVVVEAVVEREVVARRPFVGTVEAVRASLVGAEVEGLAVEFLVEEGQRVAKDQPLARLRPTVAEARLAAAQGDLRLRREELAELRNGSRPEEVVQARARVAQGQAAVDIRAWKLERAQQLFEGSVISEDELKDARLVARLAEESLAEARAALELVEAGPRAERIAQAEARVETQAAEVARLEEELRRHTVRAPFDGYVAAEHVEVGQWLAKGDPVAEVVAVDEVDVRVPVLEDYVLGLELGLEVPVTLGALPGRTFRGTLSAIVPQADPRARTFPVKVRLANPAATGQPVLRPGMLATTHLPVGKPQLALVVSKDALVLGGPQPVVYVVDGGTVRAVPVEPGIGVDSLIQVRGTLAAGDRVVVRGNERLRPGDPVRVVEGE